MKVEPTSVFLIGKCDIQSSDCIATKTLEALTVVFSVPSGAQINVCKPCLEQMVRTRQWDIEGADVSNMAQVVDIAAIDLDNRIIMVVEIKISSKSERDAKNYAERFFSSSKFSNVPFLLVVTNDALHLWSRRGAGRDYKKFEIPAALVKICKEMDDELLVPSDLRKKALPNSHAYLELAAKKWLSSEIQNPEILSIEMAEKLKECDLDLEFVIE